MSANPPRPDPPPEQLTHEQAIERIAAWCKHLVDPDQVFELRALGVRRSEKARPTTEAGFFDGRHLVEFAKCVFELTQKAKGVYLTFNPLKAALLDRRRYWTGYAGAGSGPDCGMNGCFGIASFWHT